MEPTGIELLALFSFLGVFAAKRLPKHLVRFGRSLVSQYRSVGRGRE